MSIRIQSLSVLIGFGSDRQSIRWCLFQFHGHCSSVYSVSHSAAITKYHKLGGLKEQKCVLSLIWRLEALNQVVHQAAPLGVTSSPWHSVVDSCVTPGSACVVPCPSFLHALVSSHGVLLCLCLSLCLLLLQGHLIGLRAHPILV